VRGAAGLMSACVMKFADGALGGLTYNIRL
jgi:hypothetical protein